MAGFLAESYRRTLHRQPYGFLDHDQRNCRHIEDVLRHHAGSLLMGIKSEASGTGYTE
jgi:hypothetical protein